MLGLEADAQVLLEPGHHLDDAHRVNKLLVEVGTAQLFFARGTGEPATRLEKCQYGVGNRHDAGQRSMAMTRAGAPSDPRIFSGSTTSSTSFRWICRRFVQYSTKMTPCPSMIWWFGESL